MKKNEVDTVKSILGEDIFDALEKAEIGSGIFKENTKTATDVGDIKVALQIVPRAVLGWLFSNLKWREEGENIDLELPFANGRIMATKLSPDNYSGEIIQEGKRIARFKYRSLPAIGLILMSTFELYDMSQLDEIKKDKAPEPEHETKLDKLQDIIDERLKLQSLICSVVDKRLSEREAIKEMIQSRLNQSIVVASSRPEEEEEPMEDNKKSKLREFLENREKKAKEPVELDKSEIKCPDCQSTLHKSEDKHIKLCVCYGEFMAKDIKIQKSQDGMVKLKFPKKFGIDNIEMLKSALKDK